MKKYSNILFKIENEILIITLNRPEKRNALNSGLVEELFEIFLEFEEVKNIFAVILTGAGNAFCAGADLSYLKSQLRYSFEDNLNDSFKLMNLYKKIYTYPKITLALVNGPALAGGCGLVNVCDFSFSVPEAKFGYPEVKIGFVASMVSVFLIKIVGEKKSKELLYSGDIFDATEAERIGLINKVVDSKLIFEESKSFLNKLKKNSLDSIANTKKLFNTILNPDFDNQMDKTARYNTLLRQTKEFKEGISEFFKK